MIDYRYHLTALVAVFLALGLGMLIGVTLIGPPSPESQMQDLLSLQQNFEDFRQQHDALRTETDDLQNRLQRMDVALGERLPPPAGRRLVGYRIAIVVLGEAEEARTLSGLAHAVEDAGGDVVSTTRIRDDWLPTAPADRDRVLRALGVSDAPFKAADVAASVGRAIGGGRGVPLLAASKVAAGLRLKGNYDRPPHAVVLLTATRTPERLLRARAGWTPEAGLLAGLAGTRARVVLVEPSGPEALTTIPFWMRDAKATVDNVDMISGQYSAVLAVAGQNGRFGLNNAAESPIPHPGR